MRNQPHTHHGRGERRGFALLIVMMLVALVGVGAAALLDLVNVDIGIAAEHRKSLEAEASSIGAVLESMGDPEFLSLLPEDGTLQHALVTRETAGYVMNQAEVAGRARRPIDPATSAFIEGFGTGRENGFESDVRLLRVIARENSSLDFAVAVYEVRARASISSGDASREARSIVYLPVAVSTNNTRQRHAR